MDVKSPFVETGSLFEFISPIFYYENFHSDILAYILQFREAREALIDWINRKLNLGIIDENYSSAEILREESRIDICILARTQNRAIIIENKSNNANDQKRQIPRYLNIVQDKKGYNSIVDAIIYLNKLDIVVPDTAEWSKSEINSIEKMLLPTKLVGLDSISAELLLSKKLQDHDKLRVISAEAISLFNKIVNGGLNLENMKAFYEIYRSREKHKVMNIVKSYENIPKYLATTYKNYCESLMDSDFDVTQDGSEFFVTMKFKTETKYELQFYFSFDEYRVDFQCLDDTGSRRSLSALKTRMKGTFPFEESEWATQPYFTRIVKIDPDENKNRKVFNDLIQVFISHKMNSNI